jgi:hypothetical protein
MSLEADNMSYRFFWSINWLLYGQPQLNKLHYFNKLYLAFMSMKYT